MDINYSRQADLFDNSTFKTPIHIIGAGATGSWVALFLAKLGISNITVWDFDKVEAHNIPNQVYRLEGNGTEGITDVGEYKVDALSGIVRGSTGININAKNIKVDGNQPLSGIVFVLTDTMRSRKDIYEKAIRLNPAVKLLIETRMGLEGGRVYVVDPMSLKQAKEYEATFTYNDDEAEVSACGTSQSIIATAVQIASIAVWQVIKYHNGNEFDNEILVDCMNNLTVTRRF